MNGCVTGAVIFKAAGKKSMFTTPITDDGKGVQKRRK